MPAIGEFAAWRPLLSLIWASDPDGFSSAGADVSGQIYPDQHVWSGRPGHSFTVLGDALRAARRAGNDPFAPLRDGLEDASMRSISFVATFSRGGRAVLNLLDLGPAVEDAGSSLIGLGSLVLVEGALPQLWRRQPAAEPGARPAASADPQLLERTLRERLPGAVGAAGAEIAAAQARLGMALPDELTALYRVTRAQPQDWGHDRGTAQRIWDAVGCDLLPLGKVFAGTAATRPLAWLYAATETASAAPGAAVQALVGSPGWLVFGYDASGDWVAVDLTPAPGGNAGQVIGMSADQYWGASVIAPSLTDFVLGSREPAAPSPPAGLPAVAWVGRPELPDIEAAASGDLEVLRIATPAGSPLSLSAVAGLPRLRTLTASPGSLADPAEVTSLPALEYLELGAADWRTLIRAGAVPRGLLAAAVGPYPDQDPLEAAQIASELLALWNRPQITRTVLEGQI